MDKLIKGVVPPLVTPLTPGEDVDEESLRALIEHCVASGLHAVFVAGSNGEAMSLTQSERNRLIRIAVDQAKGRVPVLCGVMDTGTRRVIDNIKAMEQAGGTVAVVTPAFYIRNAGQHEITLHFERVARGSASRIMIYNIPPFTSVNILPETVFELSNIENIIGLKDSGGNFAQFQQCLHHFRHTRFLLFQGITDMAGASILLGADGMIPVLAPLFPELFLRLCDAAAGGDIEGTIRCQKLACEAGRILSMGKNAVSAAKFALSLLGLSGKLAAGPVAPLDDADEKRIRDAVARLRDSLGRELESGRPHGAPG